MHILTLKLTHRHLRGSLFANDREQPLAEFSEPCDDPGPSPLTTRGTAHPVDRFLRRVGGHCPAAVGMRILYGGRHFRRPVLATPATLRELAPQAPLHLPRILALTDWLQANYPGVPIVMIFETSFFTALPIRERSYGLAPERMEQLELCRFGFQGILHEAACRDARARVSHRPARIVSVCLEPRPELAACLGLRPVMVTGGNTPVEGLPGERSCGDIDPSVALKLAHELPGGLEEANQVLTCESGLVGVTGEEVSLAQVLQSTGAKWQLARDILQYSILRACGAAIAALGGLDMIVYSGRYATSAAASLHDWLGPRLEHATRATVPSFIHSRSVAQHMRDIVRTELLNHAR